MARTKDTGPDLHGGRVRVPRSRGAVSGILLIVLGAWGLLVPLVGPYVDFGYTPDKAFDITEGRFWFQILPGAVTVVGGLLLLIAANRIVTSLGAWLAVAGGAWFLVGPTLRPLLNLDAPGTPIHTTELGSTLETLLLFTGLGALILFLAASALGRLAVVSVRDVRAAQRREREHELDHRDDRDVSRDRDFDRGDDRTVGDRVRDARHDDVRHDDVRRDDVRYDDTRGPSQAPGHGAGYPVDQNNPGAHAVNPVVGRER